MELTLQWDLEHNHLFYGKDKKEILKLCYNWDIFVHWKLVENDIEVVQWLRDFISSHK